jgi:hypothetical protein
MPRFFLFQVLANFQDNFYLKTVSGYESVYELFSDSDSAQNF